MHEFKKWLLAGDSSIQYMTHRFLLGADKKTLKPMQEKIESEGFCKRFCRAKRFKKLSYPYRYRYDLLRVLDYFTMKNAPYDDRMQQAIDWLIQKRKSDGRWILENCHKRNVHFEMEPTGEHSRFITLKALYILSKYH